MSRSQDLYEHAKRRIPGGTQLLSKRPEMYLPGQWPAYYRAARGVEIEDLDGRRYVDVSIGAVGACPLGYADPVVDEAVVAAVRAGSTSTLNCAEEVDLADLLCELHPWAEQVRFARGGGEAMAMAVRFARAATGRDRVAFCGYHGWHDWYLAANLAGEAALDGHLLPGLEPAGVPRALAGTALPFAFGDRAGFDAVVAGYGGELAAIVMEPMRRVEPPPGFLEHVRATASRIGAVLVFDEITVGFRCAVGGAHLRLGVAPDVAVFAKAMGNGYPIAAVVGRSAVMGAAERTFVSSTSFSERIGPAAALATIRRLREVDAPARLAQAGGRMQAGWREVAGRHGVDVAVAGIAWLPTLAFVGAEGRAKVTLFTQEMLDRGYLAGGAFYPMLPHDEEVVGRALHAVDEAMGCVAEAIGRGEVVARLRGPVAHEGFRRLT